MLPAADEVEELVLRAARRDRRCSPRSSARRPAARCCCRSAGRADARPLWQQRKRAADLLAVAARFGSFPMLLETYRECLRDVFDMPALVADAAAHRDARDQGVTVDSAMPSPFAASLLFGYVANYIYDGDAPLAERRAQALAIDQTSCASCSARPSCASCWTRTRSPQVEAQLQHLEADASRAQRRRGCTICCSGSAISRPPRRSRAKPGRRPAGRRSPTGRARRAIAVAIAGEPRSSRSRTPAATAMRSACRCRSACRSRCCSRSPTPGSISRGATRARTGRSRPRSSPRATGSAARPPSMLLKELAASRPPARGRVPPGRHRP